MRRLLTGAALFAALAVTATTQASDTQSQIDGLKKAAAGLRQLATRALPQNFKPEESAEYTKQTTWFKNAAGRCDALAKKMQAAGSKGASVDGGTRSEKWESGSAAAELPNLRSALQKENGEFSFRSQQAKARQDEAKQYLQALGQ